MRAIPVFSAKQLKESQTAGITAIPTTGVETVTANVAVANISPAPVATTSTIAVDTKVTKVPPSLDNPTAQANKQQKLLAKDKQRELNHAAATIQSQTTASTNRIHLFDHLQKKIESKSSKYI